MSPSGAFRGSFASPSNTNPGRRRRAVARPAHATTHGHALRSPFSGDHGHSFRAVRRQGRPVRGRVPTSLFQDRFKKGTDKGASIVFRPNEIGRSPPLQVRFVGGGTPRSPAFSVPLRRHFAQSVLSPIRPASGGPPRRPRTKKASNPDRLEASGSSGGFSVSGAQAFQAQQHIAMRRTMGRFDALRLAGRFALMGIPVT